MSSDDLEKFEKAGGEFLIPKADLVKKISGLKAFIFDWDGVFNNGIKAGKEGSPFSEVDSMGLNMLRFSYYLKFNLIPKIYLVTGEHNPSALHLSNREHFDAVYLKSKVKTAAFEHILNGAEFVASQSTFMFDDILDLGLAKAAGTGFFVSRPANPMLNNYVKVNKLADYITANEGGQNPVREVCELAMGLLGNFNEVVALRVANDPQYQDYLKQRNQVLTRYYLYQDNDFQEFQYP